MKTILILICLTLLFSLSAGAGVDSGGTDLRAPEHGAAWFLGRDRVIRACLEISPDFGVEAEQARTAIENSFQKWSRYLVARNVSRPDNPLQITRQLLLATHCSGEKTDLTFYLGVENNLTQQGKKGYDRPIAFAELISRDLEKGWAKGYIWLTKKDSFPDWSNRDHLEAILAHELGHVFGCDHVQGTIMDKDLAQRIRANSGQGRDDGFFNQIDQSSVLYLRRMVNNVEFSGNIGNSLQLSTQTFQRLVGRQPQGPVRAKVWIKAKGSDMAPLSLSLEDDLGAQVIPLTILPSADPQSGFEFIEISHPNQIFKVYQASANESYSAESSSQSKSVAIRIVGYDGAEYVGTFMFNMGRAPLVLNYFHDMKVWPLFQGQINN